MTQTITASEEIGLMNKPFYKIAVADDPRINSGALMQLYLDGKTLRAACVQCSAASHVSPNYDLSSEAVREYGESGSEAQTKLLCSEWALWILGGRAKQAWTLADQIRETRIALLEAIEANKDQLIANAR